MGTGGGSHSPIRLFAQRVNTETYLLTLSLFMVRVIRSRLQEAMSMAKTLIDIDDEALALAAEALGTRT